MDYDQEKYPMIWKRVSNRGYCFTYRIPCRLIRRAGKKKIEIAALLVGGAERRHRVLPENLEHSPCLCFAECRAIERLDKPTFVLLLQEKRTAMAEVVRLSGPNSVILRPQDGACGITLEEAEWSIVQGCRVEMQDDPWRISPVSLIELQQMVQDSMFRQEKARLLKRGEV